MARKKQQLINYHTGSPTSMPVSGDVQLGELVVRHATDKPELLIKKDNNEFATFIDSASIDEKLTTLKTYIEGQIDSLESASTSDLKAFSATVVNTYATSADTESAIATAKSEAVSSGKGYTDGAIATTNSNLSTLSGSVSAFSATVVNDYATKVMASGYAMTAEANAVASGASYTDAKIESLSGSVSAFSATVVNTYATSADTESAIATAKSEAVSSGKGYTDGQIAAAKEYSDGKLSAATETLNQSITTLSGNVHTRIEGLESGLTKTINEKVATAYRYKGSCTYEQLTGKTAEFTGEVWNVTDANGDFPAGTNYAWDGEQWDALGGSIDLSPYATTTYVDSAITKVNQTNTNLKSDIDSLSSATKTLIDEVSAATKATYATKTELEATSGSIITDYTNAIAAAKKEATDASSAYTDTQIAAAYSSATTAAAASAQTLQNNINTVNSSVTGLSASTVTIQGIANTAIQTASIVDGDTCKVSVKKEKTELQFDFSNLVIDCGDF